MVNRGSVGKYFVLICIFIVTITYASAQTDSPQVVLVKSIVIEGNQRIASNDILKKIQSKVGESYSMLKVRNDIKSIYGMGYFKEVAADESPFEDGIKITFLVKENVIIKDLIFVGNKSVKAKRLKSELKFSENEVFQEGALQAYINKIKDYYKSRDFVVDVTGDIEPINDEQVHLKFTIVEEKKPKILKIEFQGNKSVKSKLLRKTMKSKHSWFIISHRLDRFEYLEDQQRIEKLYKNRGYVLVNVTMEEPEFIPKRKGVVLHVTIDEGKQYKVGNIEITGNKLFSLSEVNKSIKSKTGNIYNQSEMEEDANRLYELYANQGYVLTDVKNQLSLDTEKQIVNVSYNIEESNRVVVGNIRLVGVAVQKDVLIKSDKGYDEVPLKTKEKVIQREITLDTGDVLYRDQVVRSRQRLMNLEYFDGVDIRYEPTASRDTLDLVIYMAERQTGFIQFGVGYSTDKKGEIFVDLQENNLFGSGRKGRIKVDLAEEGSEYNLSLTDPYFMDTRMSVTISLYSEILNREIDAYQFTSGSFGEIILGDATTHEYEERETGANVTFSYPVNQNLRTTLKLEHKTVELEPDEDTYVIPEPLGPVESETNSITPGIIYDSRDNIFWPSRGSRYVANVELAGGILDADNDYVKFYAEGNWYKKFGEKWLAALRLRGGYLEPYSDTEDAPISDRFFLGGANSLRGYDFRGVSPRLTYVDTANNEVVELTVGGNVLLNMNLELRSKITERFMGVIFLDAGGVWQDIDDVDFGEIRYGIGPGVVLNLPIGYFQVGYGFPFNDQPGDETQGPYFTFGSTF